MGSERQPTGDFHPIKIPLIMATFKDLSGLTFNFLTALRRGPNSVENTVQFLCRCICGRECLVRGSFLTSGHTKSCGCHKLKLIIDRNISKSTHGHCRNGNSSTYQIWANIWDRCTRKTNKNYESYGGRGIAVCERWRVFENFLADMGEHPTGLSIDRINNDGNYEPGNCRWATNSEQQLNKRTTDKMLSHYAKMRAAKKLKYGHA